MIHSFSPARRAFTLVELLTVMAIMAILSSMLFPSFGRAREMARRTSCLSNEKQLGLGILQYAQDYDERHVRQETDGMSYGNPLGNGKSIPDALNPYIKSVQIWKCPSHNNKPGLMSYHVSGCFQGTLDAAIQQPSTMVVLREAGSGHDDSGSYLRPTSCDASALATERTDLEAPTSGRHLDGMNFLYADGHAKFATQRQFTAPGHHGYRPDGSFAW